ncbi:hypothetical protein HYW21_04815 [Candidatus Woesearchaeota archaeon]|nr:hypothetical protein [Candidatus Woesearchaeota archaeon]
MYESILRDIGLSPNEARVYEALLQLGEASVQTISTKAQVHRRNVYDSLVKLTDKGLVSLAIEKGEGNYRATDPQRLLIILKEKEDNLTKVLPDLKLRYHTLPQKEQAYIYRGVKGFRNYMQDILDVGEDFYCIGAKGGWFDPRLRAFRVRFYRELREKGIHCYHLFDYEMKHHVGKGIESPVPEHLHEARFLPPQSSTNCAIDFFGDRIVTFTGLTINHLDDDMVQFVLISRKLVEGYKKWFWFMWDHCAEE